MNTMIENLINGNLSDARKQAKRFSLNGIARAMMELGWSEPRAAFAAHYLKTGLGWQAYCDAN